MKRPIAISLSPNLEKDDVLLSLKKLASPISWYDFRKTEELEERFAKYFGKGYKALAVNSGRSGLYLILKTFGIGEGDEVITQALTCIAVPNSIRWCGARPIYADVDRTFNINARDVEKKIGKKSKAIIVQHSFGVPAKMETLKKVARKKKLLLIEDCAVSLGAKYKGENVGTIGDISFFSFGRDKVISSVFGGMILCKNEDVYHKLKSIRDELKYPSPFRLLKHVIHPVAFSVILPLYNFGYGKFTAGKAILFIMQKIGLLDRSVFEWEKYGKKPDLHPTKMPGVLAALAINQLNKLDDYNSRRVRVAEKYFKKLDNRKLKLPGNKKGSIWLRFPVLLDRNNSFGSCMKNNNLIIGDWYRNILMPKVNLTGFYYKKGSCPQAEKYAEKIVNLPTYPTMSNKDIDKVILTANRCQNIK